MNECGLCMSGWYCFLDLYELHMLMFELGILCSDRVLTVVSVRLNEYNI
jgi:hypothetical protein